MKTSPQGIAALAIHEGIVPAPYLDSVGVWTFGIGHTAAAGPPDPAQMPKGMPADLDAGIRKAFDVFRADLPKYEAAVNRAVKVALAQHEFDALVSFHYNTGGIARAKLTEHLNRGDRAAAANAFMGWLKPASIKGRRQAEQRLFRDGVYTTGVVPVWHVTASNKPDWRRPPARTLTADQVVAMLSAEKPTPAPSAPATKPGAVAGLLALLAAAVGLVGAVLGWW